MSELQENISGCVWCHVGRSYQRIGITLGIFTRTGRRGTECKSRTPMFIDSFWFHSKAIGLPTVIPIGWLLLPTWRWQLTAHAKRLHTQLVCILQVGWNEVTCKDGEGYSMFSLPIRFLNVFWFGLHSAKVWMKADWLHTPSKIQSHGFKFQWKRQKHKKSHYYWEKETQESKHSLHLIWTLQVNQTHSVILLLIFLFVCMYLME